MQRRLAAVLAADISGYSRLMEADEIGILDKVQERFDLIVRPEVENANGRIFKTTGDGFLAEFPSVVDAVKCAVAFQQASDKAEEDKDAVTAIRYRVGINIGDVIIRNDDIFGDGVNVAARLESIAPSGGLCVSELVWQNLRGGLGDLFQDMGLQTLKNIDRKIRVWKWPPDPQSETASARKSEARRRGAVVALANFLHNARDIDAADFASGLVNDLRVTLAKLDTLFLTPARTDLPAEADYHIEGNVRTSHGRIRCNASLSEAATGHVLWTDRFEGHEEDGFEFLDRIINRVVSAVEIELSDGPQVRRWREEAGSLQAYELFLEGRAAYKEYARPANARARALFQSALDVAPGFLSASVGLARTHIEDAHWAWSENRQASLDRAGDILEGVLSISPEHSAAHAERSHLLMISGRFEEGQLAAELAVALDPTDADAHNCLSYLLNCNERYEEALAAGRRAVSLNPSGPEFYLLPMVHANLALQRYSEANGLADRILERRPLWLTTHVLKIAALEGAGRHEAAQAAIRDMRETSRRFTISRWTRTLQNRNEAVVCQMADLLKKAGMPE